MHRIAVSWETLLTLFQKTRPSYACMDESCSQDERKCDAAIATPVCRTVWLSIFEPKEIREC